MIKPVLVHAHVRIPISSMKKLVARICLHHILRKNYTSSQYLKSADSGRTEFDIYPLKFESIWDIFWGDTRYRISHSNRLPIIGGRKIQSVPDCWNVSTDGNSQLPCQDCHVHDSALISFSVKLRICAGQISNDFNIYRPFSQ